MTLITKLTGFFSSRRGFLTALTLIIILAAAARLYRLSSPPGYYFDEVYHALTSKLIARGDPRAYEWWNEPVEPSTAVDWLHPPLAKYTQALGIKLLGENAMGWRISSAIFGILTIALTALTAHIYFKNRGLTLLAALLASFDGLLLAQSRIAMNDVHVTFFILLTIAAYGWHRQQTGKGHHYLPLLLTGLSAGLAMGSKWSGVYILVAVATAELVRILKLPGGLRKWIKPLLITILLLGAVPAAVYLGAYSHMFLQGKSLICRGEMVKQGVCYCSQESSFWVKGLSRVLPAQQATFEALEARGGCKRLISHFSELHQQILWYQTHLNATHPYQSRPWQWVLDLRPVWQSVDYSESDKGLTANIYNVGNPLLFWVGLTTVLFLTLMLVIHKLRLGFEAQRRSLFKHSWEIGFLLFSYFIVWGPWNFSPRIMFFYHYAPAVPIMAILTAFLLTYVWEHVKAARIWVVVLATAIGLTYLTLYPLNTGLPMGKAYFETVFTLFPSWK